MASRLLQSPTMKPQSDEWESRLRLPPTKQPKINQGIQENNSEYRLLTDNARTVTTPPPSINKFRRRSVPNIHHDIDYMQQVNSLDITNTIHFDQNSRFTEQRIIVGVFLFLCLVLFFTYRLQKKLRLYKTG